MHVLASATYGGGTAKLLAVARAVTSAGDELVVESSDPVTREEYEKMGGRVCSAASLPVKISPLRDAVYLLALVRLVKRERPDILHLMGSKVRFLGQIAGWLAGVPAVVDEVANYYFHYLPPGPRRRLFVWLERFASRFGHLHIFVEKENMESAFCEKIVARKRSVLLPSGIDINFFDHPVDRSSLRAREGLGDGDFVVGYVGRLSETKAPDLLLEAYPMVRVGLPEARFIFVGDGPMASHLKERIAEICEADKIKVLGFRKEIPGLLSIMDVFAFPSIWEGLPMVLLEAMAARLPVVATDIKGVRALINHGGTGLLVPPKDPAAMAQAILHLAHHRQDALRMGREARRLVERRYTEEKMVRRTLRIYRALLKRRLREKGWPEPS